MKHGGNDQKLLIQQERTILKFLVQQALVSYLHLLRVDQSSKSVQAVEVGAGGWYKLGATVIIARGGILYLSCTAQYLLSNLFVAGPWLQLLLGRGKDLQAVGIQNTHWSIWLAKVWWLWIWAHSLFAGHYHADLIGPVHLYINHYWANYEINCSIVYKSLSCVPF